MPVVAAIGAAIATSAMGGAITTAVAGVIGAGTAASVIGTAIAGAIGGAIAGGIGAEIQGGDFWDGAKMGAIGGAISGGFTGWGGFGGAEAAVTPGVESAVVTTPGGVEGLIGEIGAAPAGYTGPTFGAPVTGIEAPALGAELGAIAPSAVETAGMAAPSLATLGTSDIAVQAGAAPQQALDLGSLGAMKATGQVGAQAPATGFSLDSLFKGTDPAKLAMGTMDLYNRSQAMGNYAKTAAAQAAQSKANYQGLVDLAKVGMQEREQRNADIRNRIDAVYRKWGVTR